MDRIKIIDIDTTDSTNRFMREYAGAEGSLMTVVVADYQTAGRGQGANTWESEPGSNLLFSVKTRPAGLPVRRQFVMLEAGALAVRDALSHYVGDVTVKWPNDVYWRDCKISGTLSECAVGSGGIGSCIIGTGINVNQREFHGGAPNPVSLAGILGHDVSRRDVLRLFINHFGHYLGMVDRGAYDDVHRLYCASLYRREGVYAFRDAGGRFAASIARVEPDGRLVLRRSDGGEGIYLFKEVGFII